jgi:hypothetical protein
MRKLESRKDTINLGCELYGELFPQRRGGAEDEKI